LRTWTSVCAAKSARPASAPRRRIAPRHASPNLATFRSAEIRQVDHKACADGARAQPFNQFDGGNRGAAGGDQIVDDQNLFASRQRVFVDLDGVFTIFERVALLNRAPRQLALLAHRHEADRKLMRHRATEDEPARFNPRHLIDADAGVGLHQLIDHRAKRARIAEQGGDVAKHHARLGVIWNGANCVLDIHGQRPRRRRCSLAAAGRRFQCEGAAGGQQGVGGNDRVSIRPRPPDQRIAGFFFGVE